MPTEHSEETNSENPQNTEITSQSGDTAENSDEAAKLSKEEDPKAKRYLEQLKGREAQLEKVEALLIKTATEKVEQDNDYLLKLYEEDPTVADKVAKQFGVGSAKEAIAIIKAAKGETTNLTKQEPKLDKEELFREWEARMESKQAMNSANKILDALPADVKAKAQEKFETLVGGRSLSSSELTELAEMASVYVQKDSLRNDAKDKAIAGLSSTSLGKSNLNTQSKGGDGKDLAESMGLGHLYK